VGGEENFLYSYRDPNALLEQGIFFLTLLFTAYAEKDRGTRNPSVNVDIEDMTVNIPCKCEED